MSSQGAALQYVSPRLKGDEKVVSAALQSNQDSGKYLANAADKFKANRGMVELAMKHSVRPGSALQYASNDIRGDAEFLEKAIDIYGGKVFLWAADDLKRNDALLLKAIKAGLSYEHFGETGVLQESLNRRPIMKALVRQNADALELARQTTSGAWAADFNEIVIAAVQRDGMTLEFASPKLQADRKIVLAAVQSEGMALKFASPELQADRSIVLAAVQSDGDALEFASEPLRCEREVILDAAITSSSVLECDDHRIAVPREFQLKNPDVVKDVQKKPSALQHATPKHKKDKTIVHAALRADGDALQYADPELQKDKDTVILALRTRERLVYWNAPPINYERIEMSCWLPSRRRAAH